MYTISTLYAFFAYLLSICNDIITIRIQAVENQEYSFKILHLSITFLILLLRFRPRCALHPRPHCALHLHHAQESKSKLGWCCFNSFNILLEAGSDDDEAGHTRYRFGRK